VLVGVGAMMALQLLFTYAPVMNRVFHSAPIEPVTWVPIIAVGIVVYAVVGAEKWLALRYVLAAPGARPEPIVADRGDAVASRGRP
jgi:tellurite resistance protein TehA-like permease